MFSRFSSWVLVPIAINSSPFLILKSAEGLEIGLPSLTIATIVTPVFFLMSSSNKVLPIQGLS